MPASNHAEVFLEVTGVEPLAEVIQLPKPAAISFYVRNSGALPQLGESAGDYGRGGLPTPVAPERDTVFNRFRELLRTNRPSWL